MRFPALGSNAWVASAPSPAVPAAAGTLYACVYAWALEVAARPDIAGWFDSLIQH